MERDDFREKVSHGTALFPLASYRWDGEFEYTVNLHWHDEIEIIYFEKGTFQFECNSREYVVNAPALAFVDAGVMHSVALKKGQRENAMVFDCRILSYEWYDEAQGAIITPLINRKVKLPPFIYPEDEGWEEINCAYNKALREAQKGNATSNLRVKLYLTELLSILYENHYMTTIEETGDSDVYEVENVKKIIAFVREHLNEKIKISDVAQYIGMNEQYFCRYFKKMMGKTLTEYINELRIDEASVMLTNTNEKIINIALQCGYGNISYFIKRFKNVRGITPQEYREKFKTIAD